MSQQGLHEPKARHGLQATTFAYYIRNNEKETKSERIRSLEVGDADRPACGMRVLCPLPRMLKMLEVEFNSSRALSSSFYSSSLLLSSSIFISGC